MPLELLPPDLSKAAHALQVIHHYAILMMCTSPPQIARPCPSGARRVVVTKRIPDRPLEEV
jgi:hypothetical protein